MAEAGRAAPDGGIVFVVGTQRSGSTLLRLMLDHHPRISCAHEFDYGVARVGPQGDLPPAKELHAYLEGNASFRRSGFEIDRALSPRALLDDLLHQGNPGRPWTAMTVHRHIDRLPQLWPQARFIHLLRDPRDVARSWVQIGWAGNAWAGAAGWEEAEAEWDRVCAVVPAEQRVEIHYEALLEAPSETLTAVCSLLSESYDAAMLSYPETSAYPAPDPSLAFQWRRKAQDREVQQVEARLGDRLPARGYTASGLPARAPGAFGRTWLEWQHRLGRLRFRTRRYGVGVVVADAVARRIGATGLAARTRQRIFEADQAFVR